MKMFQSSKASREGLTAGKILRFLALPFCPRLLKTYMAVQRFEDIAPERLIADGIRGVLVDADGTLGPHGAERYPESIVRHIGRMAASGLKVALFTNASTSRFRQFQGVSIVAEARAKPDRRAFESAMKVFLNIDDPESVCMIGDNYVTDGGAVSAGMRFIYVQPVEGGENLVHRATRKFAYLCAKRYFPDVFKNISLSRSARVEMTAKKRAL